VARKLQKATPTHTTCVPAGKIGETIPRWCAWLVSPSKDHFYAGKNQFSARIRSPSQPEFVLPMHLLSVDRLERRHRVRPRSLVMGRPGLERHEARMSCLHSSAGVKCGRTDETGSWLERDAKSAARVSAPAGLNEIMVATGQPWRAVVALRAARSYARPARRFSKSCLPKQPSRHVVAVATEELPKPVQRWMPRRRQPRLSAASSLPRASIANLRNNSANYPDGTPAARRSHGLIAVTIGPGTNHTERGKSNAGRSMLHAS
jgi:hypothetical protein